MGLSQEKLADALEVTQPTVFGWEAGTPPKRIGLPRIAEALGKTPEWLQYGDEREVVPSFNDPQDITASLLDKIVAQGLELERLKNQPLTVPEQVLNAWPSAPAKIKALCLFLLTGNAEFLKPLPARSESIAITLARSLGLHVRKKRA